MLQFQAVSSNIGTLLWLEVIQLRYFYSFLLYLAMPYLFLRLWWRGRKQPQYAQRLGERLGFYPIKLDKCIWVHAVSVGETLAAIPLIKALQSKYTDIPMLITTMTPTGAARVKAAFNDTVTHAYIPYDFPDAVARFLANFKPIIGVIMETELWPNLLHKSRKTNIPLCLVNARLSDKSARGYSRIAGLTREMLNNLDIIAAHGHSDAERFVTLGAPQEKVMVTGNIKFDLELPANLTEHSIQLRNDLGNDRFIWVAASTHEGEEEVILAAHKILQQRNSQALLILVPRHPERFDAIAKLSEQSFKTVRRSSQQACTKDTGVYLGDTMGELLLMYAVSDVAFVAGSLIPRGGHNMLEPGALGKPIITGTHLFNFAEISQLFLSANAMVTVSDADALSSQLIHLMENNQEREFRGQRSLQVISANRGALAKQMHAINQIMPDA